MQSLPKVRIILAVILIAILPAEMASQMYGQTLTFPATSTPNVFTNTNQFTIGLFTGPTVFANLAVLATAGAGFGTTIYCSDCQQTSPCLGSGSGAIATYFTGGWICGIGPSSIPASTPGYPLINQNGAGYNTSPQWVDATATQFGYPGVDMCVAIINARKSSSCAAHNIGCIVKAPFTGPQYCSVNPFPSGANGWDDGGTLDFSNAKNLDIRTAQQWIIPNAVHLVGAGHASATLPAQNTILRANNTTIFNTGGANFLPTTESLTALNFGAVSGGLQTITTPHHMCGPLPTGNSPNNGQDIVITNGTNQVYHGFAMHILGCSGGSGTSYQIAVTSAGLATICTGGCTAYEGRALIHLGPLSGAQNYGTTITGMSFDCAWVQGCIPLINNSIGEHGWIKDTNYWNFGAEGFRYSLAATAAYGDGGATGGGASQFGETIDIIVQEQNDTCENPAGCGTASYNAGTCTVTSGVPGAGCVNQTTTPDAVNQSDNSNPLGCYTLGFVVDGPKGVGTPVNNHVGDISNFTILLSNGADGPATPGSMSSGTCGNAYAGNQTPISILLYGILAKIRDFSSQFFPVDVEIGGNATLNAAFPGFSYGTTPAAITTYGITIDTAGLVTTGGSVSAFAIDIGPNATAVNLLNLSNGNSAPGNTLKDNVTGNICTDVVLAQYFLGEGTPASVINSCGLPINLPGSFIKDASYLVCGGPGTCTGNSNAGVPSNVFGGATPSGNFQILANNTSYSFDCKGAWLNSTFVPTSPNVLSVQATQNPTYLRVYGEFGLPTDGSAIGQPTKNTYAFLDSGAISDNTLHTVGTFGGTGTVETANTSYPFKIWGSLQTGSGTPPQLKFLWAMGTSGGGGQTLQATPESYCKMTGVY